MELTPENLIKLRTSKGLSQQELADVVGVSQRTISMWEAGETKPKHASVIKLLEVLEVSESVSFPINGGIPLIPIEAMAGFGSGAVQVLDYETDLYKIPEFDELRVDFMIRVKGSSMYPKYSSGDIVACKKLSLSDLFFQWNKVYVLDTEQGAIIKRIKPSKKSNHISLISENSNYDTFELPLNKVNAVALVVGVIRFE